MAISTGGSGGSRGVGGGLVEGCGRSTWIGYDRAGVVTMKMISSTSMTSTSGVTLISAMSVSSSSAFALNIFHP